MQNLDRKSFLILAAIGAVTLVGIVYSIIQNYTPSSQIIDEQDNQTQIERDANEISESEVRINRGSVNITNLNQVSSGSDPLVRAQAARQLYRLSTQGEVESPTLSAEVRSGSFSRSENNGYYRDKMIVDIPELEQSWGLVLNWSKTQSFEDSEIQARPVCLNTSDLRYDDFNCESEFGWYDEY